MVKNWCKKTPDNFRFTAKFSKVITHDKRLKDIEKELELFFSSIINLEDKILALLIQLPPSMHILHLDVSSFSRSVMKCCSPK